MNKKKYKLENNFINLSFKNFYNKQIPCLLLLLHNFIKIYQQKLRERKQLEHLLN